MPTGYSKTLSEMYNHKFVVTMRNKPYLELANCLRDHSYEGVFEVHVTVSNDNNDMQEKFKEVCGQVGCKAVMIELPTGVVQKQLMTSSYHVGNMKDILKQAFVLSQSFVREGFNITRTKLEALFSNRGVPITDQEAQALSPENYFEFHIKVVYDAQETEKLLAAIKPFGGHLSKNAFKKVEESKEQRFVTLRLYGIGKESAAAQLEACTKSIRESGFQTLSTIREYSVYDSNVHLDKGWIDKAGDSSNSQQKVYDRFLLTSS